MARERTSAEDYTTPLKRLLTGVVVLCLLGLFLVWRIDSPRVERFRAAVIDSVMPGFEWAMVPVNAGLSLVSDVQSYQRLTEQNRELRRELQQMKAWKEAALQLEQENARLLDLNNVRLDPRLTFVTGVVLADSGSPFRQTVLVNVGARDGIVDGWAAMDGLGLVGRISGVGASTSRVILLTDGASRVPATLPASGQKALVIGDNQVAPPLDFVENPSEVRPGDRVVTSGEGGVFPPGLLLGEVVIDPGGRMRVRLAADYEQLEFLRILRDHARRERPAAAALLPPAIPPSPAEEAADVTDLAEGSDG
ncbi:rod shape-determining protein MreC [Pseudaestuariivita sp.]|uniref:rod shape-determining protein MreC n=1 Tax=Pseudaestuariivita sp. TaxID=2211669 RepID=UPI004058B9FC